MHQVQYHEAQQRLYWEYAFKRDEAMEKAFNFGFAELPQPFHHFPEGVLNPWCPLPLVKTKNKKIEEIEGVLLIAFAVLLCLCAALILFCYKSMLMSAMVVLCLFAIFSCCSR